MKYIYNIKTGEIWQGESNSLLEAVKQSGFNPGDCKEITEDEINSLQHEGVMEYIRSLVSGLGQSINNWEKNGRSKNFQELGAVSKRLLGEINQEASKNIYWIAWIKDGDGNVLKKVIDTGKKNGERLLIEYKEDFPDAVIEWKGPMDYNTGRRLLENVNNNLN